MSSAFVSRARCPASSTWTDAVGTSRRYALLDADHFDFAVLDINLGVENSLGFADRLRRTKLPFLFASGCGDKVLGESRISELVVSKPYDADSLSSAISLTLCRLPQVPE